MLPPWQTRASDFHPYRADDLGALPESLRGAAKAALPAGAKVVSALVVPTDYRSSEESEDAHSVPEQALVFTDSGVLHVQASLTGEAAPSTVYIRPENLLYLQSSHILLYGRLELFGSVQSEPVKLVMEFNAVAWPLMEADWRGLVCQAIGLPRARIGRGTSREPAQKRSWSRSRPSLPKACASTACTQASN